MVGNKLKPHGKGIYIYTNGSISMRYSQDGVKSAGSYIYIDSNSGKFVVGEYYLDAKRVLKERGTDYEADGNPRQFG